MANRHLSRSIILQSLFEWDFGVKSVAEVKKIFARNAEEFASNHGDFAFMDNLLKGVLNKRKDIDLIIEKAAPDWPIEKISVIDRNILRIGLYELLFADRSQVPPKVAINEAKELGQPGKDETSRDRRNKSPNTGQVLVEQLGGAVVYAKDGDDIYLALVHDVFGRWTLSKGKIGDNPETKGESVENGTVREIKEELGLNIKIKEKLGENEYIAYHPEKGKIRKHVVYFLAESKFKELKPEAKGGLDDAKWFKLADILDLNFYNDILPLVTKAINILLKKPTNRTN